jgi:hypothetical protein
VLIFRNVNAPTVDRPPTTSYPSVRRLVTTNGEILHGPSVSSVTAELTRLTGRVSSLAKSAAVIVESARGGVMSVHYERRFGFLISVRNPGDRSAMRLIDPALPDEQVVCETPSRARSFSRRSFVAEHQAVRAALHFAETGERCPKSNWSEA